MGDALASPRPPLPERDAGYGSRLCEPAPSAGQFAHMVDDHGALNEVELSGEGRKFCKERIGHDELGLALIVAAAVLQQEADADFECVSQAFERRERGCGLAVLDFGDVSAWHLHASGQLTLAETAAGADLLDGRSDIDAGVFRLIGRRSDYQLRSRGFRFFVFEGLVATPAE